MRVCVVGSGGREHALAVALARTAEVVVTPGNPGMVQELPGGGRISITDAPPEELSAGLFVVGPEVPLVEGLADRLRAAGHQVVGPGADGARLEGSKAFMKELLAEARIPTARFGVFDDLAEAGEFLRSLSPPWVVKTDGLAGGKGVLVTDSLPEALKDVEAKLSGRAFGEAGRRVVLEEGLVGTECSLLALTDGSRVLPLLPAQDFKRLRDGGQGPNTGGMGSYCPVADLGSAEVDSLMELSVEPLLFALRRRGIDYRGVLYAGLMLTEEGPRVLEYNVRFGDPEAQVVLPLHTEDLTAVLSEVAAGHLRTEPRFSAATALCVVLAAEGYPENPRRGDPITGIEKASSLQGVSVLHAGTDLDAEGRLVTAGGRVLDVVAEAGTIGEARHRAYQAVGHIHWDGITYRSDIGAEVPVA